MTIEVDWPKYWAKTKNNKPRAILPEALNYFYSDKERNLQGSSQQKNKFYALDLGSGAGNESIFLLQNGFKLFSVDLSEDNKNAIVKDENLTGLELANFTFIQSRFEELNWDDLPQFDFICSLHSLAFCHKDHFLKLWHNISSHMRTGAILTTHLYGIHSFRHSKALMEQSSLLELEIINKLIEDFTIIKFNHIFGAKQGALNNLIFDDTYEFILKKN